MEKLIAYHCAPALAGIKPGNIVTCHKSKFPDIHEQIQALNAQLNQKDIFLEILHECDRRVLLFVYRKKLLTAALQLPEVRSFLQSFGYPEQGELSEYLKILRMRLCQEEFPHEIGAFLGYPLHDIYGFMHHKDENCLLCGEWKVYHEPELARKLFHRFAACRKALSRRIAMGYTLAQVFCVA